MVWVGGLGPDSSSFLFCAVEGLSSSLEVLSLLSGGLSSISVYSLALLMLLADSNSLPLQSESEGKIILVWISFGLSNVALVVDAVSENVSEQSQRSLSGICDGCLDFNGRTISGLYLLGLSQSKRTRRETCVSVPYILVVCSVLQHHLHNCRYTDIPLSSVLIDHEERMQRIQSRRNRHSTRKYYRSNHCN